MEVKKNKKYIFVTGGVVSGLGKGITAASHSSRTRLPTPPALTIRKNCRNVVADIHA